MSFALSSIRPRPCALVAALRFAGALAGGPEGAASPIGIPTTTHVWAVPLSVPGTIR
jgi:hypothetical protein